MSHTVQTKTVSASQTWRTTYRHNARRSAWIGSLFLLVSLFVCLASTGQDTSAQIIERIVSNGGVIAYVTSNHEIWVSNADGNNTRKLWEIPQAARSNMLSGIQDLTWRKDGSMLAFVSGHEPQCSLYETNIYVINADGSDLRRITNRPTCQESANLATGTVTVDIRNDFNDIQIAEVTVEGAMQPTFVSLLPRQVKQVTIPNVPDLGQGVFQAVVAIEGSYRWFYPGTDVIAGQTVHAGELLISAASRVSSLKVWDPSWSPDGQTLAFLLGGGIMQRVPLEGNVLERSTDLLSGDAQGIYPSELAWSPVDDRIIFTTANVEGGRSVYSTTVGSSEPPVSTVTVDDTRGLAWLPDGSGFVMVNYYEQFFSPVNSNLWYIDLTNNQANQLTMHESEFVFSPSVSPDGQQVIFNYAPNLQEDTPAELRIMSIEGGAMTTFGPSNIAYGAWGPAAGTTPTATPQPGENDVSIYLPYTVR